MKKDFLWGGATAANQYEGGYNLGHRGLSINDVELGAHHGQARVIHDHIQPGYYYPPIMQLIFIIMLMKISL